MLVSFINTLLYVELFQGKAITIAIYFVSFLIMLISIIKKEIDIKTLFKR